MSTGIELLNAKMWTRTTKCECGMDISIIEDSKKCVICTRLEPLKLRIQQLEATVERLVNK
jgi:hypothetical protein